MESKTLTKCSWGCGLIRTLINCCWECKWAATWEDNLTVSYKVYFLPCDLAIMFLGVYLKEVKAYVRTKNLHMNVFSSFVHNCRNLEATKMYFRRWMDKLTMVHPENRLFRAESSSHEKSWRKLTCILPSERTQSESTTILYDYNYKALWKSKMTSDF